MQGTLSSMRKLIGPRRPTYKSYYISQYDLPDPYSDHRKIRPRDDTDRCSQCVCPLRSRRSRLYKATARVQRKERHSTALKKSPLRTTTITTVMAKEPYELLERIRFQRGPLGAVRYTKR